MWQQLWYKINLWYIIDGVVYFICILCMAIVRCDNKQFWLVHYAIRDDL